MNTQLEIAGTQPKTRKAATKSKASQPPFCEDCGLHIGTAADPKVCGACKRELLDRPAKLSLAELTRFVRLVRKHWGDGDPIRLIEGESGYRPTLVTALHPRLHNLQDVAGMSYRQACAERAELADLYDRIQFTRGDQRRACRS